MRDKQLARLFGKTVRYLRQERSISQEAFALLCGVHRTYMGSIERGEKMVSIETASKIAKAFDIPLSRLFVEVESERLG